MFTTTSIAGRHAADQRRVRAAQEEFEQQAARHELDAALRMHGLTTHPHFNPALGCDRTLWVSCRPACPRTDYDCVWALLDVLGWHPDPARLSRHRTFLDVMRIRHGESDARLCLIVKVPHGEPPAYVEAA